MKGQVKEARKKVHEAKTAHSSFPPDQLAKLIDALRKREATV